VIRIHIPRLADRKTDIPQLAQFFLKKAAEEMGEPTKTLHSTTVDYLCHLPWPGNVRQLENTCRWLTVMAASREIRVSDLPVELREEKELEIRCEDSLEWDQSLKLWCEASLQSGQKALLSQALPLFEKAMIEAALTHTEGRKIEASELLGWGRNTLTRKLKELDRLG